MTQDEMVLALSMHGFERTWIRGSYATVPFVGSVRATMAEFSKTDDDGSKNVVHLLFPMEGIAYNSRSLKFLHRKALKDLERWNVLLPPEVLNVLRHCT